MPYCQYCGTKLEDGQSCTCEMSKAAANQPPQPQQPPVQQPAAQPVAPPAESQVSVIFKKFKQYLSVYISNPEQAIRSVMAAEHEMTVPVVLTVIRLLAMGLAIYGLLSKACKDALSIIAMSVLRFTNTTGILTANLTASVPKCLVFGALIAAIGMFLFMVMIFVIVKIQHGSATFSEVFKASAANGVPTTTLLLLAFLFSFASVAACVVFVALAMLCWIISGVLTAQIVSPNSSSGAFGLMYFVGVVLILVVGYYVIPPMFNQAVGGITASYMGETVTLQKALDEISKTMDSTLTEQGISSFKEFFDESVKHLLENVVSELWRTMY